jgi:4-hydroxythreonine-4-phosphate dehydrogenase
MTQPIAIVAGEPNSISSEIIFKSWKSIRKYKHKPIVVIGSIKLLEMQREKLNFKINIQKIDLNFKKNNLSKNKLNVIDVSFNQATPFKKISSKSNEYIFKCFELALILINKKKVLGLINCPVSKEFLFNKKYQGITEYLANKSKSKDNEVMLLYNKKLSVSPMTTHVPISSVSLGLNKLKIIKKIKIINNFYRKHFAKKPNIAILGFNPHNYANKKKSEEKLTIVPAILRLRKSGIKVLGPISADTSFVDYKKNKFDIIIGMYHDQVLTPFKAIFNYQAINVTLGLPFIRVTPDHGVAENIMGKNIASPVSLITSILFFNKIK